jgi:glycosyltransferase involved in cell wall biosynthesis
MIEQIKKDFVLSSTWNNVESIVVKHNNSDNILQFRWSGESSSIYILNEDIYTYLKTRIYNGHTIAKKRILNILLDEVLYKTYIFTENINYIDVKLNITNKKSITFSTEDYFCPSEIEKNSTDKRKLGFKFYSFTIESINNSDTLIPIREFSMEAEEEFFIDSDDYNYNISRLASKNDKATIFYVGQYGTSGYANAAKGYIYRYFINNYNIKWSPLKFDETELSIDCPYNIIAKSTIDNNYSEYDTFIYHSTPDLWESLNAQFLNINKNKKKIGYTVWETSNLPKKWTNYINNEVDEVWCPSSYNYQVFQESGINIPIKVVPHIFLQKPLINKNDILIYNINGTQLELKDDVYTFYTIGEFNARKGLDDLIHTFCKTFTKNDKVRLLIKTHYKNYAINNKKFCLEKINTIIKQYDNPPEIHYFIDNLSEKDILSLHSIGDCYISLTKSEGFGMTIFDAFNYGKKIIATGYSGHLDFLGKDYTGLVNYKLDYVKNMKEFSSGYSEDTVWAYPDLEHAAELMKGMIK